ncbi:MAG: bifunctional isocitrate dehydrogenase kinase/phosphatase [Gemmatimonadetes bacterium]|nr:bifunctional isocitrate dehydrogenase kinase/phosphatase [Gemmatimonadota bacterium]
MDTSIAGIVCDAYAEYRARFEEITRRARVRFEQRDWGGMLADHQARLLLYGDVVQRTVARLRQRLGAPAERAGGDIKAAFARSCGGRPDRELAETFYNSVLRRVYAVVGVDRSLEFVGDEVSTPHEGDEGTYRRYGTAEGVEAALRRILWDLPIAARWADLDGDAARVARRIEAELAPPRRIDAIDILAPLFFRNKGAYVVGRIWRGDESVPLVLALLHPPAGVGVDAVLLTADETSVVFGFTRSYFHVEAARPSAVVDFLRSLMPHRRPDELYTAVGFNRHGKTELYRALMRHLAETDARFELAPGARGMVMCVFTLPSFNVVFKLIKDRFAAPKRITRSGVIEKYQFIFVRDRVGRLADAQPFERLEFRRECFSEELLRELRDVAAKTVSIDDERVVLEHLYTERRVVPLNLYLAERTGDAALDAILDYGQAIKDLAAANIFPGDMLLKNFGVTRHGRVIFYDYDEVDLLTNMSFRVMPPPRDDVEAMADTPWFHVGEHDVFPEEFPRFLGVPAPLRDAFHDVHGDLFTVDFWRGMQERVRAGEIMDFFPYRPERRLHGLARRAA